MTNAEKFLKDGVSVKEFIEAYLNFSFSRVWKKDENSFDNITKKFFEQQVKPKLTEDERVILRNLPKEYKYIHRVRNTRWLELSSDENDNGHLAPFAYDHLFQFIKERRRIRDKRIVRR